MHGIERLFPVQAKLGGRYSTGSNRAALKRVGENMETTAHGKRPPRAPRKAPSVPYVSATIDGQSHDANWQIGRCLVLLTKTMGARFRSSLIFGLHRYFSGIVLSMIRRDSPAFVGGCSTAAWRLAVLRPLIEALER
jgi:hypothetical protein